MHEAEVRVNFSALLVSCLKAGMIDAAEALWDWGEEWLNINREELEEELDLYDTGRPPA